VQVEEQKKHQEQEYVVPEQSSGNWFQCLPKAELLSKSKEKYIGPVSRVSLDMRVKLGR